METVTQHQTANVNYEVLKANNYARGVAKLREVGEQPKTFKKNIEARVVAYENGDKELFNVWLDSCTAIVSKKRSTKIKVVPQSIDLINIPANFREPFLPVEPVDYDDSHEKELDSNNGKYNQLLEEGDILGHDGWLAAVEGDVHLLDTYRNIIFNGFKKKRAMGFYVRQNTEQDGLRALLVHDLSSDSDADGGGNLDSLGSFLRGSPVVGARSARAKKTGSAYRNPAMTEEERLTTSIEQELSRLDGFVGTYGQENYAKIKQEVAQNLKGLYKR